MQHWVYQSLRTSSLDESKRKKLLRIMALSLTYAHLSGYKVRLHTDTAGAEMVKDFPYDEVRLTLDQIPDSVPTQLFAAGKFYAMREEGPHTVHIDLDVLLKKPVLDLFFSDKRWDIVVQCDETRDDLVAYTFRSQMMHIMGYPIECHPSWPHTYNVGVIGFHDKKLFERYVNNYFEALDIYTVENLQRFAKEHDDIMRAQPYWYYWLDFNLEQQTLHWMSLGHRVMTLIDDTYADKCAEAIGYAHLQGGMKYDDGDPIGVYARLCELNPVLAAKLA